MSAESTNIPGLDTILRGEIMRKDALIQQLVGQNKELMAARERQDIELTAQRETIQEHRTHIDVLDSALSNGFLAFAFSSLAGSVFVFVFFFFLDCS